MRGEGRILLIGGESGIGKTRILVEAVRLLLGEVAGLGEDPLLDAVNELSLRSILREARPGVVRFDHHKLWETAYAQIDGGDRLRLHAEAAAALERRIEDALTRSGRSGARGSPPSWRGTTERAERLDEGAIMLREALELADSIGYRAFRSTACFGLALVAERRSEPAGHARWIERAFAHVDETGERRLEPDLRRLRAHLLPSGSLGRARALDEAAVVAELRGSLASAARARIELAELQLEGGEHAAAAAQLESIGAHAGALREPWGSRARALHARLDG